MKTFYVFAFSIIAICIGIISMAAGKKVPAEKKRKMPDHVPTVSHVKQKLLLHAGNDEHYPDAGYDEDGWSLRGYMSSHEMAGKHLNRDMDKLQRFEQRKAKERAKFVEDISYKAKRMARRFDVPASILAAQAILETNYGTSRLCNVANNMFGHMGGPTETSRGIAGSIKAYDRNIGGVLKTYYFRVYESLWWSMWNHMSLLEDKYSHRRIKAKTSRESYMAALCGCKDSRMLASDAMAEANRKGGFLYAGACAWTASDGVTSRYIAELKFIIEKHKLDKLDE